MTGNSLSWVAQVVQFREVCISNGMLAIVMEYVSNITMADYLRQVERMTERDARVLFQQLVFGLDFCHHIGLLCRDLKLEHLVGLKAKTLPSTLIP